MGPISLGQWLQTDEGSEGPFIHDNGLLAEGCPDALRDPQLNLHYL